MLNLNNLICFLPEFIILLGVLIQIICLFFKASKTLSNLLTILIIFASMLSIFSSLIYPKELVYSFCKMLILLSSLIIFFLKTRKNCVKKCVYFNLNYLFSIFFLLMIAGSNNYISLFLNIEFFSISLYFLFSMDKHKISFSETLKYMFLSILSSYTMLLGVSFIYGITGSIDFQFIIDYIDDKGDYSISTFLIPYILIIAGILFKIGAFPFARWIIDIYSNIDTKVVAYVSVVPKLAVFSVLTKILGSFICFETSFILILFAIYTAMFGAIYGLQCTSLKNIMAVSSYVNISYMLLALAFYTKLTLASVLFYWITYIFMNIGAFAGIIVLEHSNLVNCTQIYRGYFYKNPLFSLGFAICLISLLGFPLTAGFIAKIYLIATILSAGVVALPIVIIMFVAMVISVCFYLRPFRDMFITIPYNKNYLIKTQRANKIILFVCSLITILIGIFPFGIINVCESITLYF